MSAGFFADGHVCAACHSSCATCFSRLGCQSCGSRQPLLGPDGSQCLASCPPGSYQADHTHCRRCHESCTECHGPGQRECASCSDPTALLRGGECVGECGTGFYSQAGVCYDCHPSCRSCVGPLASDCLQCLKPEEVVLPQSGQLQHGVCTAGCPAHKHLDDTQTCRAPRGCLSRVSPLLLALHRPVCRQLHVLSPAIQPERRPLPPRLPAGFFVQDGQCQACHPSCLTCSGPSQADCVSCPSLASLQDGYCRTSCPDGLFLHAASGECLGKCT
ncbi:unnamed protein product [Tetraodon nigroviridis]|uniref:(spotted green pufferfish) hypothetical protein n=1 Tax=Tetraodon nigroviridis TaxID=99883 RepID=Q4RPQ0_TETNG|nr:unnamed protein product [Tetraodon nigroviridis]